MAREEVGVKEEAITYGSEVTASREPLTGNLFREDSLAHRAARVASDL